ncbi:hypothetical protein FOA43_004778 [Brettanomyces nanus]|uniref:Vacuolar protein sorting-associated protein 35 n=1 Tax=Eeniella nana TaxID=13502 RepID=A0A875SBJ3_EENNA|nr:uncharacterized protein FOA43_004778 [Brettanomyces nanus]QPG77365.1 hypothetical protein FOA43_004778 [Brettanomyces nanus]
MSNRSNITPAKQAKILDNSITVIRQQIVLMRKCLETKNRFMDALKHTSTFLNELRTNYLTPKQYYELYVMVYDGLEYLSQYLKDTYPNSHLADLYELVQYAGNIVPRLYLMITVGTVYMGVKDAPLKEIMTDMMEMCRGVQHPIRGLFLRYYLSQRTKDLLPTSMEGDDIELKGNLKDSIHFIITNFIEMNKLWVRWQHQGHSSEHLKRVEERKELQILVGSNLVRLSQMDSIDRIYYKKEVLPVILEQIVKCRDLIAQEYLLDVIIQVFPDEFHLITMDEFFDASLNLDPAVSIKNIVLALIDRLIGFKVREPDYVVKVVGDNSVDIFGKIIGFIDKVSQLKPDMSVTDYSSILEGVCKLSITYYPEKYSNIDKIFEHATEMYKDKRQMEPKSTGTTTIQTRNWKLLLLAPVTMYEDVKKVLQLDNHYLEFFNLQSYSLRRSISVEIVDRFLKEGTGIITKEELKKVFTILEPLIVVPSEPKGPKDVTAQSLKINSKPPTVFGRNSLPGSSTAGEVDENEEELKDSIDVKLQQECLAKLLHLIYNKNPYKHLELLQLARDRLQPAQKRVVYTYPTLVAMTLKLVRKLYIVKHIETKEQRNRIAPFFTFITGLITVLGQSRYNAVDCFNLNLMSAEMADEVGLVDISYDFFIESLVVYEESFVDSRSQYQALMSLINKLISSKNMIQQNMENFDRLITKTTLYSSKLLRKTDQCRAVCMSSHLWWIVENLEDSSDDTGIATSMSQLSLKNDGKRVLECLQKSLRIADSILDKNVSLELFIEILNQSLYFFIHGNDMISVRYLNGLIELIRNNFKGLGKIQGPFEITCRHFERTLKYIREQKSIDPRFEAVTA